MGLRRWVRRLERAADVQTVELVCPTTCPTSPSKPRPAKLAAKCRHRGRAVLSREQFDCPPASFVSPGPSSPTATCTTRRSRTSASSCWSLGSVPRICPKRPVPKVEMRVILVVGHHSGAPGRTHILPQGNESRMKILSTWQMRRPQWSDRVCLSHAAPVIITSLQIHTGVFTAPATALPSGASLLLSEAPRSARGWPIPAPEYLALDTLAAALRRAPRRL